MNDYDNWKTKIHPQGALVIHDIYENLLKAVSSIFSLSKSPARRF